MSLSGNSPLPILLLLTILTTLASAAKVPNIRFENDFAHVVMSEDDSNVVSVSHTDPHAHDKISSAEAQTLSTVPVSTNGRKPPFNFDFAGGGITSDSDYVFKTDENGNLNGVRAWGVTYPYKGIDFLGRGYNIFTGSPKAIDVGGDPGFKEKVFNADTSEENTTEDWTHVKPKNIEIYTRVTCSLDFSSSTVSTESSLQSTYDHDVSQTTSIGAKASFSGWGANVDASFDGRWTSSSSFKGMSQSLQKHNSLFIFSEAKCSLYEARIQKNVLPAFSAEFSKAIEDLPKNYDPASYTQIISDFGTHVLVGGLFGSKMGRIYEMTTTEAEKLQSQGTSISKASSIAAKISGGYSGGVDVSASASVDHDESSNSNQASEAASSFLSSTTSEKIYSVGALPPEDGDARQWAAEVAKDEAMPIQYELMPMGDVVALIDSVKGKNFAQAYAEYLRVDKGVTIPRHDGQIGQCSISKVHRNAGNTFAVKSMVAECAEGSSIVGGSMYTAVNHPRNPLTTLTYQNMVNWAFPSSSNQFIVGSGNPSLDEKTTSSSIGFDGALCCKTNSDLKLITIRKIDTVENVKDVRTNRASTIHVECPPNYGVVSGGFMMMDIEQDRFVEVLSNAASSETSWECKLAWTTSQFNIAPKYACYARCAALNSMAPKCSFRTKQLQTNKGSYLSCPSGMMVTGLGWKVLNRQTPITKGEVFHVDTTMHRYSPLTGPRAGVFYIGSLASANNVQYEAQLRCCDINNNNYEAVVADAPEEQCKTETISGADRVFNCEAGYYLTGLRGTTDKTMKTLTPLCCRMNTPTKLSDTDDCKKSLLEFHNNYQTMSTPDGYFMSGWYLTPAPLADTGVTYCKPKLAPYKFADCYNQNIQGLLNKDQLVRCRKGYRITKLTRGFGRETGDLSSFTCCQESQGMESVYQESLEDHLLYGKSEVTSDRCETVTAEANGVVSSELPKLQADSFFTNKKKYSMIISAPQKGASSAFTMELGPVEYDFYAIKFEVIDGKLHLTNLRKNYFTPQVVDLKLNPSDPIEIWFEWDHAMVTVGKGTEAGKNVIIPRLYSRQEEQDGERFKFTLPSALKGDKASVCFPPKW